MKYDIAVLADSPHTQAFAEVAQSVAWALQQLGHEVMQKSNVVIGDDWRTIVFGARPGELTGPISALPNSCIIYNGEQVNKDGMWPSLVELYKRHTIWDYSAANAKRYTEWGLPEPKVVRPGYCPTLDDGRFQEEKKTHDVVFFGSTNERREKVLKAIESDGFTVLRVPFGVYGAERDALIASARLCVNIHYYESAIFEAVRCSYLAQCGVPVISESSVAGENTQWGISAVSYSSLASFVCNALGGDLESYGATLTAASKNVSILDDVRSALAAESRETEDWAKRLATDLVAAGESEYGPSYPSNQPKRTQHDITLCMIVKDEKDVIERCLASVRPLLTRWCIVDTGSTDGTQDIIRKFMADLPGQLHECSWKEFDGSRTEAIDLARAECKEQGWLLQIDADEILQLDGELKLPDGYDCYNAWFTRCDGCTRWARPMFMRANKPWFYEMPRHEALYCRYGLYAPSAPAPVPNVQVISTWDGARAKDKDRFLRDAKVLEAWLPQHPGHYRCVYYIAQSYHCAATATDPIDRTLMQKAAMNFLKRAEMANDHPQETFSSRLKAAECMMQIGYPWEKVQHTYLQAYALRPSRAEPIYYIGLWYRKQGDEERVAGRPSAGQYALAELFLRQAVVIGPSEDTTPDVDHSINDWRAKDELANCLTYLNRHAEARDLYRHALLGNTDPVARGRIEANLEMCKQVAPDPA
jgi:glycosyltransferase involved in cell wall biosynthesis